MKKGLGGTMKGIAAALALNAAMPAPAGATNPLEYNERIRASVDYAHREVQNAYDWQALVGNRFREIARGNAPTPLPGDTSRNTTLPKNITHFSRALENLMTRRRTMQLKDDALRILRDEKSPKKKQEREDLILKLNTLILEHVTDAQYALDFMWDHKRDPDVTKAIEEFIEKYHLSR